MTRPSKSRAIERLRKMLDAIPELKQLQFDSSEFVKWRRGTRVAITNTFGIESQNVKDFNTIDFSPESFIVGMPDSVFQRAYVSGLESAAPVLESMIDEIEEYWEDENQSPTPPEIQMEDENQSPTSPEIQMEDENQSPTPPEIQMNEHAKKATNEIFIVHGRDKGAKNTVARFLEKLDLKPVILAELPGKGRTIIEKFEEHAQVGYAIVLLTPDDAGSLQGDENELKPRARQNVIFELGFFIGHLGRERVCALTRGHVEIPSNYAGIEYIPFNDSGDWQLKLIRELKSVGFKVDANRAL